MRKSFTRLFSIVMLFSMICFMAVGADITPPSVVTNGPSGADVKRNLPFTVEFSEPVQVASGTGIVGLYDAATNVQLEAISVTNPLPAANLQLSTDSKTLTITFAFSMVEEHGYYITITGDAFQDAAGNRFGGIGAPPALGSWPFTTGDYTPANLVSLFPTATVLAGTATTAPTLKIKFDDNMVAGPGMIDLYKVGANGQGTIVQSILATAFDFTTATEPKFVLGALDELAQYYVRVDADAFRDDANVSATHPAQYFGGINNSTQWKFTISDVTAPVYSAALQSGVVGDVAKNGKIIFTFTDNRPNFVLQKYTAGAPATVAPFALDADVTAKFTVVPALAGFTATYKGDNKVEIAPPATGWLSGVAYTVNINDASYFSDVEFNRAAIGGAFAFTAGDFTPPTIGAGTAVAAASLTNTKINLSVDVSAETTLPAIAYYYVVKSSATQPSSFSTATWTKINTNITALNTAVTVNDIDKDIFGATLESGTAYKVYVVVDDSEPTQDNFTAWNGKILNITTSDIIRPSVQYVKFAAPADVNTEANYISSTTGLAKDMFVIVKFDEPVTLVAGATITDAIEIKKGSVAQTTYRIVGDASQIAPDRFAYRIDDVETPDYAPSYWRSNATYTVKVVDSKIKDLSGAGNLCNSQTAVSFSIRDFEGPNPKYSFGSTPGFVNLTNAAANNKANVPTNSTITIDLGEPVYTVGTTLLDNTNLNTHLFFREFGTGILIPATATIANNQVITLDPVSNLIKDGHQYTIELTATMKDAAGNKMGNYELGGNPLPGFNNELITFSTADETSPLITLTPGNGATVVKNPAISVSINDIVFLNNGDPLNPADANMLRSLVSLKKVSDGSDVQFDITGVVVGVLPAPSTFNVVPFGDLEPSQSYTLAVTGLYDNAVPTKNSAAASSTFTVREYTAPTVIAGSYSPANGTAFVAAGATVSLQFSEPVIAGAGNITITNETNPLLTQVIPVIPAYINAANNTVTIPHVAFSELNVYHITIDATAITDVAGNAFAGIASATAWKFSAFDATAPTLFSTIPADNDLAVYPQPSQLKLTFADNNPANVMKANGGYIYVNDVTNTRILTVSSNSSNVTYSNNVVTIAVDPSLFAYNGPFWIEVEPTAFADKAGNPFAGFMGIPNSGVWNFTIGADQAPWITALAPVNDVDRVDPNTTLKITFNEPVRLSAVPKQLNIYDLGLGVPGAATTIYTTTLTSTNTTLNNGVTGTEATITIPSGTLLSTTEYEVRVLAGAFEDVDGIVNDPLYAIDGSSYVSPFHGWKFKTKDVTPPVVTFTVPSSNTPIRVVAPIDYVANNSDIVVRFDETVQIATPATAVTLSSGAYTATFTNNTLVINPTVDFGSEAVVTVTLAVGAVKDLSNNNATGTITFTAADKIKPTWDVVPAVAGGITATAANVGLDMSEAGKVFYKIGGSAPASAADLIANKTGELVATGGADVFTISGLTPDASNTIYFVGQDVPKPNANVMVDADVKSVTLTTLDNIAPQLKAITDYAGGLKPADGASCVATNTTFELNFDDDMAVVNPAKVWIRQMSDNHSVAIASVVAGAGANSKKVIITPAAPLAQNTEYYLEIDPVAFTDESGNIWDGIFYGTTRWNIKTADETAPAFAAIPFSPVDDAIVTSNNPTLTINFNEKIQKGSGFIYVYRTNDPDDAAAQEIINVTNADVLISANETSVSFPLHNTLSQDVSYYVAFASGVFKDKACSPNNMAGIPRTLPNNTNTTWNFVGKDVTPPSIYSVNLDGATGIATVGTATVIEFSEVVQKTTGGPIDLAYVQSKLSVDNGLSLAGIGVAVNDAFVTAIPYPRTVTQVTITNLPYASEKTYNFTWAANSVKDAAGLVNASPKTWSVSTRDDLPPYVKLWTPTPTISVPKPLDQAKRQVVTIEFDEPVLLANNVYITNSNVASLIGLEKITGGVAPVAFTATMSTDNKIITITPSVDLQALYEYRVTLKAAANNLKEVDDYGIVTGKLLNVDQTMNFIVIDHAAPVAGSFVPADNATNIIALTAPLQININNYDPAGINTVEKMKAGTGSVNIYRANGTVFDVVAASACDFTTNGLVKIPHLPLENYTGYYVTYATGTFKDLAGNDLAGISSNTTWNFATHDATAPYPLSLNPSNGQSDVPTYSNLKIYFSENVYVNNPAAKISIYNKTNNPTDDGNWVEDISVGSVVFSGSDVANGKNRDIVTIDPVGTFGSEGVYYIRISADAFKDVDNNTWKKNSDPAQAATGFDSYNDWWFTNSNNAVPAPISWNPVISSIVPVSQQSFTLGFNRQIAKGSGKIRLYEYVLNPTTLDRNSYLYDEIDITTAEVVNGTELRFSFTKPLLENVSWYYINIDNGAVTNTAASHDAWGGYLDPNSWKFSTDDNTAPTISAISPLAGANDLANTVNFQVTFSENVVKNTGSFKLYKKAGDVLVATIPVADATLTDNNKLGFTVTGLLDVTSYYLLIDAGIVNDLAVVANPFAGVTDKTTYEFTVTDNNPPTLVATPNGGAIATNVFTVNLAFSEPVVVPEGAITVDNGATLVLSTTDGITYQAVVTAQSNTNVTMAFANSIVDLATPAHPFVGLPLVFNVTGDAVAPTIVSLSPADGTGVTPETGVVRYPNLAITFSEPVVPGTAGAEVRVYKQDVSAVNTLVSHTTINASMISNDGLTLTVPVVDPLMDNMDYVVLVNSDIVKSLFGVNFAGISDPTTWNFKTGDNTAPILTITDNQSDDLNTKQDILVTLQFNEAVWGVAGAVSVTGATSSEITSGVDGDMNYTVAIKAADLANVSLTVGTGVTDRFGRNHMVSAQTVNFIVGDNTAPTVEVTGSVVANTVTATLTFDENVTGVASAISATGITEGTLVVDGPAIGKVYTVTMSAIDGASVKVIVANTIADASGNTYVGGEFGPYVVGDNTAPTATAVPASGATNLKNNFTVEVTFNEPVTVPDGAITVTGGTAVVTAPVSGNTYSVAITAVDHADVTLNISNAVKDASNNLFAGATYTYTVGDNTAPTAVVDPVSGTTGLKNTFTVDVTFNETVTVPEGAISVGSNATATVKAPVSGNTYSVTITAADGEVVTLNVSDAVKDASGNAFAATSYTYTVGDNTAPYVVDGGYSPADGDMNLGSQVSLKLTFNEDVLAASATSEIKVYEQTVSSTNTLVFQGAVTSEMISGNVVTMPITYVLKDNTSYTVLVDNGIVKDASGNVFATGFTDPTRWNFQVGDNTAPTVTLTPAGASAARNPFDVTIKFSEPVVNVNSTTVTVDNGEMVLTPVGTDGTTYKATISAADGVVVTLTVGTGIKDVSLRNSLPAAVTGVYTIGDNTAPTLTVTDPVAPVAKVFTVGLKFNESVTGLYFGGSAVSVTNGKLLDIKGTGANYTLSISANEMTNVTIVINDAIADASGNKFAGVTLNYTTGDFTAPQMVTATPTLDDQLDNNHPTFKLTFSEDVKLGAGGNLVVYKVNTTTPILSIPVTAGMISGKNVTVDYTTTKGLDVNTRYYVLVDGTALTDIAGNAFEGVSDVAAWTFKTGSKWITGTEQNSSLEFKVFPNPFVDVVNVISSTKLSKIVVTNIAGQVVKEVVNPSNNIQLNELRSGIYFISLYDMDNVIAKTAKIVKR